MIRLVVETNMINQALCVLAPIVPKKPSRDILKCLKLEAKMGSPDTLRLFAAGDHLETFASVTLDQNVVVKNEGSFVVPAKIFIDYMKAIDTKEVKIETEEDGTVKIKTDGTEFEVGLQDLDEFPRFPEVPSE